MYCDICMFAGCITTVSTSMIQAEHPRFAMNVCTLNPLLSYTVQFGPVPTVSLWKCDDVTKLHVHCSLVTRFRNFVDISCIPFDHVPFFIDCRSHLDRMLSFVGSIPFLACSIWVLAQHLGVSWWNPYICIYVYNQMYILLIMIIIIMMIMIIIIYIYMIIYV